MYLISEDKMKIKVFKYLSKSQFLKNDLYQKVINKYHIISNVSRFFPRYSRTYLKTHF